MKILDQISHLKEFIKKRDKEVEGGELVVLSVTLSFTMDYTPIKYETLRPVLIETLKDLKTQAIKENKELIDDVLNLDEFN